MLLSLLSLCLLLLGLSFLGLSVASFNVIKKDSALLPALGFATVITLSYIFSANFNISGANAVLLAILLPGLVITLRARTIAEAMQAAWGTKTISTSFLVALLPILSLLVPALLTGFSYFYGSVNFDFFYNSQDGWFLQTHSVLDLKDSDSDHILPLTWSAGFQGRFGASLLAAFFAKWFDINTLVFNSYLLNTLVVIFALSISVFCREFFQIRRLSVLLVTVLLVIMSAAYSQAYAYYLLGQLSALPIFVLYCIFLKRLLDHFQTSDSSFLRKHLYSFLGLALLFNALYVLYAILSFYALALTIVSFVLLDIKQKRFHLLSLIQFLSLSLLLFCLARILTITASLQIIQEWLATSVKVAAGNKAAVTHSVHQVIVFSEYLKDSFLALLFGVTSYPSINSLFGSIFKTDALRSIILFFVGFIAFLTYLASLALYIKSTLISRSAKSIIVSLTLLTLGSAFLFFITLAPYGIFKVQTWFIPLLMPIFIFGFNKAIVIKHKKIKLAYFCAGLLLLNVFSTFVYLGDFLAADSMRRHANVRGVTGNRDIEDLTNYLHKANPKTISLFLANGVEAAWLMNFNRQLTIQTTAHNLQPLADREFPVNPCSESLNQTISTQTPWIMPNPNLKHSDLTSFPVGARTLYSNNSFVVLDPSQIATYVYFGKGTYPVELTMSESTSFPKKFRWVEQGAEILIYSDKEKVVNLEMDVMPGYVETKEPTRHLLIKTSEKTYPFTMTSQTTLKADKVKLRKGLTCLTVESPDKVNIPGTPYGLIRRQIPYDPRLLNFAISRVEIRG